MKKELLIILMSMFALNLSAQSVESLAGKSKTTQKEKDDAAKAKADNSITTYNGEIRHRGIDWDVDYITLGLAYNYSKHFPLTINANCTISYFSIIGELGANMGYDQICRSKIETSTYSEMETDSPLFYISLHPGFYYRYFSVNFGIGALLVENTKSWSSSLTIISEDNNSFSYENHVTTGTHTENKAFLVMKPSLIGYIPVIEDDCFITLSVGYSYLPKFQELNGISFGVGFQKIID